MDETLMSMPWRACFDFEHERVHSGALCVEFVNYRKIRWCGCGCGFWARGDGYARMPRGKSGVDVLRRQETNRAA